MILIYNILILCGLLVFLPIIIPFFFITKKRRFSVFKRLGFQNIPSRDNVIWVHALSVGEVISSIPFVNKLKKKYLAKKIYFSASTKTGFEIANKRLKKDVFEIFFFPYDFFFSVKSIINKVNPELVIIIESDIWPNFLFEMKKKNIPTILLNARLSKRSLKGYKRFSYLMKPVFSTFEKICAQSEFDANRFKLLGLDYKKIVSIGNLKYDQKYPELSLEEKIELKKSLKLDNNKKILIAGSTHAGEEKIILKVFASLKQNYKNLILIIAPRDPKRAEQLIKLCKKFQLTSTLRSQISTIDSFDVMLIDSIGILTMLYSVSDIAFIGGSLVDDGGHNPLEPAYYKKPIIFGPFMSDFCEISNLLIEANAAIRVNNEKELEIAFKKFLENDEESKKIGNNAYKQFCENHGAVDRALDVIETIID